MRIQACSATDRRVVARLAVAMEEEVRVVLVPQVRVGEATAEAVGLMTVDSSVAELVVVTAVARALEAQVKEEVVVKALASLAVAARAPEIVA